MLKDTIEKFKEKHSGFNFEEFIQSYLEGESRESLCSKYNVSEMPLRGFLARLGLEFPKSRRYSSYEELKYRLGVESNVNEIKLVKELEQDVDRLSNKNRKLYQSLTIARDEANSLRRESRKEVRNEASEELQAEIVAKALDGVIDRIDSKYVTKELPLNTVSNSDLMTMYPYTDLHVGLLALKEVSGYDFDLKIAEQWVLASMEHLVQVSPNSETCLIAEMGDFLHAENDDNRTKSGHSLDVDTRHSKIIEVAFNLMISLIEKALTKHKYVKFLSISGNHSENSSHYLKAVVKAYFRNEPRVQVIGDSRLHQYYQFGKVLLGYHHGHATRGSTKLVECMLEDNLPIISDTKYRYWHIGHLHSNNKFLAKEDAFCSIEIHKNLPPRDAWAAGAGFRGNIGQVKSITYHKDFGEIGRNNWVVDMLPNN